MISDFPTLSPDDPKSQRLDALHAMMREIRGTSIDQAIWIDVLVTDMLASFFCSDKERRALLSSEVLSGRDSSFSGRLEVLERIAKKWFPEFVSKHAQTFKRLDKIRRFRNRLAQFRRQDVEGNRRQMRSRRAEKARTLLRYRVFRRCNARRLRPASRANHCHQKQYSER